MSFREVEELLWDALEPMLASQGVDLEDVTVRLAGKRRLVRLLVDKDGGILLDDVAAISKAASAELDKANPLGEASYVLEVSSLGVERPLTRERHWRRNVSRLVRVHFADGREAIVGRVLQVSGADVALDIDGQTREIALDEIAKAVVQVDFKAGRESSSGGKLESA